MGNGIGKCTNVNVDEQIMLENCTGRNLVEGPYCCLNYCCWTTGTKIKQLELKLNQWALITDEFEPEQSRIVYGPSIIRLRTPFEKFGRVQDCPVLDQDDYIVVTGPTGEKRTVIGPGVFKPLLGETWTPSLNATIVPLNHYIIIKDNNDKINPIKHIRGPAKFIPEPYQSFVQEPQTKGNLWKCIETTDLRACQIKKTDGTVFLIDRPMFYMPDVGETILDYVDKTVMIESEFCIIKGPDGKMFILDGRKSENRSFFLKPFHQFIKFKVGTVEKFILTTLPTFISHGFVIRTSDNVLLELDLRISYQIYDPLLFGSNPIDFYQHIINWCQNELLDLFARVNLRDFMKCYSTVAFDSIAKGSEYFAKFGINMLDIQIINYSCKDPRTQELLNEDIKTHVIKQNELKAKEADVLIKEKENVIRQKQKDMEVEMAKKDMEVELKKKELGVVMAQKDNEIEVKKKELEVNIRMKELELQIDEEKKRTSLLDIKRDNAVKEGEFEGKAQGRSVGEFMDSLGSMPTEDKIKIWCTLRDLEKSHMIYSKVESINMYPPNADIRLFQVDTESASDEVKKSIIRNVPIPEILNYSGDKKTSIRH